jgi:hypothetical protein
MPMATATARVLADADVPEWGWRDELRQLAPKLPSLPPAARQAVADVVASFACEDARRERVGTATRRPA